MRRGSVALLALALAAGLAACQKQGAPESMRTPGTAPGQGMTHDMRGQPPMGGTAPSASGMPHPGPSDQDHTMRTPGTPPGQPMIHTMPAEPRPR